MTGLEIYLYLDNFEDRLASLKWFAKNKKRDESAFGLEVYLYEPNTFSTFSQQKILAAPGMQTDIKYNIHKVTHLPAPYGSCFDESKRDIPDVFLSLVRIGKKYNHLACRGYCFGKAILDKCGCIDVEISSTLFLK